jgi:hypothetical protein
VELTAAGGKPNQQKMPERFVRAIGPPIAATVMLWSSLVTAAELKDSDSNWIIVPATSNPVTNHGSPFMFAWHLDTKTGALEMCTYDPGGWNLLDGKPAPESLNCTRANLPDH